MAAGAGIFMSKREQVNKRTLKKVYVRMYANCTFGDSKPLFFKVSVYLFSKQNLYEFNFTKLKAI